jgi:hypothetical protein
MIILSTRIIDINKFDCLFENCIIDVYHYLNVSYFLHGIYMNYITAFLSYCDYCFDFKLEHCKGS